MKNKKGFTLIELLVVIAIIGILSSVMLSSLRSAKVRAQDTRRMQELVHLKDVLNILYDSNSQTFPVTNLGSSFTAGGVSMYAVNSRGETGSAALSCTGTTGTDWPATFKNNYFSSINITPTVDPLNNNFACYVYIVNSTGKDAGFVGFTESDSKIVAVISGDGQTGTTAFPAGYATGAAYNTSPAVIYKVLGVGTNPASASN